MIAIYRDEGVSVLSADQVTRMLKDVFPQCNIGYVSAANIIDVLDRESISLFVMPGGADVPYHQKLRGAGNSAIRNFVELGGTFLGICAGSYYGGALVEFAIGTAQEVKENRELAFFPGTVRGPNLAPYCYFSLQGSRAALIKTRERLFRVYYNGGGYFVGAEEFPGIDVLARYEEDEKRPAIISCRVGRGKAILSGVHFEYDPKLLVKYNSLNNITAMLQESNQERLEFIHTLLKGGEDE